MRLDPRQENSPGAAPTATRANETRSSHEEISLPDHISPQFDPAALSAAQADGFECVAGCGYDQLRDRDPDRPMRPVGFGPKGQVFICSRCADRDAIAERDAQRRAEREIVQAKAQCFAEDVTQRVVDAIEASEKTVFELLEGTGISIHRLSEVCDGRDCFTVSEVAVLTLAAGVSIRAMFGPIDTPEVAR
ncbi:hypothetical protein ACIG56_30060 [Nocardia fusca]|uniref:hypothetical protein n=1 Tax=Nocardia fusca TaxID=941183 RepID=UPI0037C5482F